MIESLMIQKQQLTYLSEGDNCATALTILEEQSLRCAPVLDATATLYRGNLYRYHIYQYAYHHPEADLSTIPVTHFLKNTTRVVRQTESFYHLIFTMMDLPYIAVLSAQNTFLGIIRHTSLLDFLAQAWAMKDAGYVIAIDTIGHTGELAKLSRLINRFCDISAATTLEKTEFDTHAQSLFVLPNQLDAIQLNQLTKYIERRGYAVKSYKIH